MNGSLRSILELCSGPSSSSTRNPNSSNLKNNEIAHMVVLPTTKNIELLESSRAYIKLELSIKFQQKRSYPYRQTNFLQNRSVKNLTSTLLSQQVGRYLGTKAIFRHFPPLGTVSFEQSPHAWAACSEVSGLVPIAGLSTFGCMQSMHKRNSAFTTIF